MVLAYAIALITFDVIAFAVGSAVGVDPWTVVISFNFGAMFVSLFRLVAE